MKTNLLQSKPATRAIPKSAIFKFSFQKSFRSKSAENEVLAIDENVLRPGASTASKAQDLRDGLQVPVDDPDRKGLSTEKS